MDKMDKRHDNPCVTEIYDLFFALLLALKTSNLPNKNEILTYLYERGKIMIEHEEINER